MTKRAFIWDLDGTLLDSYDAILAGLEETYASYQLPFDRASIKDYILKHSVQDLLVAVAAEYQLEGNRNEAARGIPGTSAGGQDRKSVV